MTETKQEDQGAAIAASVANELGEAMDRAAVHYGGVIRSLEASNAKMLAALREGVANFLRYASHDRGGRYGCRISAEESCDCGFSSALRHFEEAIADAPKAPEKIP